MNLKIRLIAILFIAFFLNNEIALAINSEKKYLINTSSQEIRAITEHLEVEEIDYEIISELSIIKASVPSDKHAIFKNIMLNEDHVISSYGEDLSVIHPEILSVTSEKVGINDSSFGVWNIEEVTSKGESYAKQTGDLDTVIGIIDSGIDHNHPSLNNNIVSQGESFVENVDSTEDVMGHGTMVAGIAVSNGPFVGIAPDVGIIPYKVFHDGDGKSSWVMEAIVKAVNDGVDVINLSLGTYITLEDENDFATLQAYETAIKFANDHGVTLVTASGTSEKGLDISSPTVLGRQLNSNDQEVIFAPAMLDDVITVSGTSLDRNVSYLSNYGDTVDISAPSGDYGPQYEEEGVIDLRYLIQTTYPTNLEQSYISQLVGFEKGYDLTVGTSIAAPHVSATIALLKAEAKERGITLNREEIENIIRSSATNYNQGGDNFKESIGIINTNKALDSLIGH